MACTSACASRTNAPRARDDRRAPGRHEGACRAGRRPPRVERQRADLLRDVKKRGIRAYARSPSATGRSAPGRALAAAPKDAPDRVDLRDGEAAPARDEGSGLARCRARDGVQLAAERTWRRLDGHEKLPLVRAGVRFRDGARAERDDAPASGSSRREGEEGRRPISPSSTTRGEIHPDGSRRGSARPPSAPRRRIPRSRTPRAPRARTARSADRGAAP